MNHEITINETVYIITEYENAYFEVTTKENFNKRISNANLINKFYYANGFKTLKDVTDYMKEHFKPEVRA